MSPSPPRLSTLGALSVDEFMRTYWQRAPVCVRGALPAHCAPLTPTELFALARREEVESRLIQRQADRWTLKHGPLNRLPSRKTPDWTVLVQGVDLHHDAAHALLQQFRFIADARLDDLMISFATEGGGVGPHIDAYDVFLVQAHGRRRWRVAPPGNNTLVPDVPLKLLAHFEPTQTWDLAPGDLLYLPPGWGHDGVALGDCMTLSVGFRAPSRHEFLAAFLSAASEAPGGPDPRYRDRARKVPDHAAQLSDDQCAQLVQWASAWRAQPAAITQFIGCFLTEPKPTVWFQGPAEPLDASDWLAHAQHHGIRLARATRMLWRDALVFANGELISAPTAARPWLALLAKQRALDPLQCQQALRLASLQALWHAWYEHGWLLLDTPSTGARQP